MVFSSERQLEVGCNAQERKMDGFLSDDGELTGVLGGLSNIFSVLTGLTRTC